LVGGIESLIEAHEGVAIRKKTKEEKERIEQIKVEKMREDFLTLQTTVESLWDVLQVKNDDQMNFLMDVEEFTPFSQAMLHLYQKEERSLAI